MPSVQSVRVLIGPADMGKGGSSAFQRFKMYTESHSIYEAVCKLPVSQNVCKELSIGRLRGESGIKSTHHFNASPILNPSPYA